VAFALEPAEVVRRRARQRSPGASYFESICDESRAYWLGFIAADGWLAQEARDTRFGVQLAGRDADHLTLLAGHLDLGVRPAAEDHVVIKSGNAALVHDLRRAGITERKSSNPELVLAGVGALRSGLAPALRVRPLRWRRLGVRGLERPTRPRALRTRNDAVSGPVARR
jgi:hypothetical protein